MQLSELLLNRQLYKAVQDTSTQDSTYMSANSSQTVGSGYAPVTNGAGEAAYAVNTNTPTVSGTKIRAGYIDSENYDYTSPNQYTNSGMQIDLNNGIIRSKQFFIDASGNAYFAGNISATTGSIGGWVIGSTFLRSTNSVVYLYSSGTIQINDALNTSNKDVTLDGEGINFFGQGIYANTRVANVYSDTANGDGIVVSTLIGNVNLSAGVGGGDITVFMQDYGYFGPSTNTKFYTLGTYGGFGWTELYFKPLAANPTAPDFANGSMYYNGATEEMRFYTTGSGWKTISTGSVSLTLSALTIDTTKNWGNYGISNVGSITSNGTVAASLFGGTSTEYMGSSIGSGIRVTNTGLTVYGSNGLFLSGSNKIDFQSYTLTMDSDKLAIVQTSEGFNALHCIEAPDVWFMDFCDVKGVLDPMFEEVTVPPYRYIKCEDDGGYQVWGKRKGHDHKRFESKTREEFDANERFLRMNQPNYQIGLRKVEGV